MVFSIVLFTNAESLFAQEQTRCFFNRESDQLGLQEHFLRGAVAVDGVYTYVVGSSINGAGDYDVLLTKYDETSVVWSVSWGGTNGGDDYGAALTIDSNGNILVAGTTFVGAPVNYDALLLKYSSTGNLLWSETFDHIGLAEGFVSVEVDSSDDIYACGGRTSSTLTDYLVVKYSPSGTELWSAAYDHLMMDDVAVRMVVSGTSVRVSGATQTEANTWVMTTLALSQSTGGQLNVSSTGGDSSGIDKVHDVATDGASTYVVGEVLNSTGYDWKILKLDASLEIEWDDTYDLDGLDDGAKSIALHDGYVYVSGYATRVNEGKNIVTRKYSNTGTLMWTNEFHLEEDDEPEVIRIADDGNVVITGSSFNQSNKDIVLLKLNESTGDILWNVTHNGKYNSDDVPYGLVEGIDQAFFVAANIGKGDGSSTYTLIQFDERLVSIPQLSVNFSGFGYITNKGQLLNTANATASTISFYDQSRFPSTYVGNKSFSYQLSELISDSSANYHRVEMQFMKGNANPKDYGYSERSERLNLYLAHLPMKSERTPHYNAILRAEQYAHTDILFTRQPEGYRHWIVARPGAPTGDFQMAYSGQDDLTISSSGELIIATSQGDIVQKAPKAYTMNTTTGALTLLSWQPAYTLVNPSTIGFTYPGSWSGTLVIELDQSTETGTETTTIGNLDWSTFVGGTGREIFYGSDASPDENVWVAGEISNELFAALTGNESIVGDFVAQSEMLVARFDELCRLSFVTIYGGSQIDQAYGVAVSSDKSAMVVGWTQSSNMPVQALQGFNILTLNGGTDAFVFEVDNLGVVQQNSYLGGAGFDIAYSVAYHFNTQATPNGEHEYWIVGYSGNGSGFPQLSTSGYQQEYTGGLDGFVVRLSGFNELNLTFQTFFGSNANDIIYDVAMIDDAPVFCGLTLATEYSNDLCQAPSDGHFPNCAEGVQYPLSTESNYFLARLETSSLNLKWSTAIGEAPATISLEDARPSVSAYSGGVSWENPKYIAIALVASKPNEISFPTHNPNVQGAFYQPALTGSSDGIYLGLWSVSGLNQMHNSQWATFLGSEETEASFKVLIDHSLRIHLTGTTTATSAAQTSEWCETPSSGEFPLCNEGTLSYMETDPLNSMQLRRTFIMSFDSQYAMRWSTLFGSQPRNGGRTLSVGTNKLFLAGLSQAEDAWTLYQFNANSNQDYWQPFNAGNNDGSIARFDIPTILQAEAHNHHIEKRISVYPNPTNSGKIFIDLGSGIEGISALNIYSMDGRNVVDHIGFVTDLNQGVDIRHLSRGTYLLTLLVNNQTHRALFVVK